MVSRCSKVRIVEEQFCDDFDEDADMSHLVIDGDRSVPLKKGQLLRLSQFSTESYHGVRNACNKNGIVNAASIFLDKDSKNPLLLVCEIKKLPMSQKDNQFNAHLIIFRKYPDNTQYELLSLVCDTHQFELVSENQC